MHEGEERRAKDSSPSFPLTSRVNLAQSLGFATSCSCVPSPCESKLKLTVWQTAKRKHSQNKMTTTTTTISHNVGYSHIYYRTARGQHIFNSSTMSEGNENWFLNIVSIILKYCYNYSYCCYYHYYYRLHTHIYIYNTHESTCWMYILNNRQNDKENDSNTPRALSVKSKWLHSN